MERALCAVRMERTQKRVRHAHEEKTPDELCKLLLTFLGLEVHTIPNGFLHCFEGKCPEFIKLKICTGCSFEVDLKEEDGMVIMYKRWSYFVEAHELELGYFLIFKKINSRSLKVIVFDQDGCEKVIRCAGYHTTLDEQYGSQLY